jgi:hypothetical protein
MIAKAIAVATIFSIAPIQCAHDPDPNARREDSPGDALWTMSQKFASEHNDVAEKETLEYLISQYPSSRHFGAAREELARLGGVSSSPPDRGDAGNSG